MADPTAQDITGTLGGPGGPMDLNGLIQAMALQQAQQQAQMSQQTAAANQQAGQAGQAYGQAAAAPEPFNPLAGLLPALLGNVASVISQQPKYSERGAETAQLTRAESLKKRADNLQALHENFLQKAKEAKAAGDLETETKNRNAAELNAKRFELAKEAYDRETKLKVATLSQEGQNQRANLRGGQRGAQITLSAIDKLNYNIRQDPDLKDYAVIRDQYTTGLDAAKEANSLGDIILMRAIARATDPRTGVREEEYRTFDSSVGSLNKLGVKFTTAMIGKGQLTPAGRAAMVSRLKAIYQRKGIQARRSIALFNRQVKRYQDAGADVEADDVLKNYDVDLEEGGQPEVSRGTPATGAPQVQKWGKDASGNYVRLQ